MNALIDAAVTRTRTTLLMMAMVLIAGLIGLNSISIEAEPTIEVPFFAVMIYHEGISPEDSERLLVMPMERELRSVEGVRELTAYASEGSANLMVEFDAMFDLDEALVDLREAVDRAKPELPSTAEEPIIQEQTASEYPILQINFVAEDVPERTLYNIALDIRNEIEALPEVLEVQMQGHREEVLEVIIDPAALEAYQLSAEDLINMIVRNNRLIPAGAIDTGEGRFSVKVPSVIETARDVYDLPIRTNGDAVITLRDVAEVRRTFKDRVSYARVNGQRAISLNMIKRASANIIDTADKAKAIVERHRPNLPSKIEVSYTLEQAPFAKRQVAELQGNILTALALVMILVVAAMGFRSGVIVGMGIPVSFLFSLIILAYIGFTFNFMVMFGMLLALGMLIDGAIVVTEYADRKMTEGLPRQQAYSIAAKRMFWPVVASVATTLAAFLPLMFWPGVPGKFMRYLPVTVFCVLSGSLLYALVFGPALGAVLGKAGARNQQAVDTLKELEDGDPTLLDGITGAYARALRWCSLHAGLTFLVTLSVLIGSFMLYGQTGRGIIFFSDTQAMYGRITVRALGNLSVDDINYLVKEVEQEVLDIEGVKTMNTMTLMPGEASRFGMDRIGIIFIELHEEFDREMLGNDIFELIRERTRDFPGISVELAQMEQGPPVGKPIQMEFSSHNNKLLEPTVRRVRDFMNTLDGVRDIDDTRSLPGIEWKLSVDRAQAALYGADVTLVGIAVQLVTGGVKVGEYRPDRADDAVDIRVRYPEESRGISALDDLRIMTRQGSIPISNFVTREPVPNVDTIQRIDGIPVEFIRADVAPGVLADTKVGEIKAWLDTQEFDERVDISFRGANEEQADSIAFVTGAFGLSLLLMFVLLVTQFNSLYQSVLILFAVVMSTAGVLLGLVILGSPFSAIMTGTGVVALAGIVVNNNIVLIDTYNKIKQVHPELDYVSVIVRTGAQRLRPVVLTTVTTIFGLLPLASNFSIDLVNRNIIYGGQLSTFWVPLSQAIVSGLAFASILTLFATPAMLALPYRLREFTGRIRTLFPQRTTTEPTVQPGG